MRQKDLQLFAVYQIVDRHASPRAKPLAIAAYPREARAMSLARTGPILREGVVAAAPVSMCLVLHARPIRGGVVAAATADQWYRFDLRRSARYLPG